VETNFDALVSQRCKESANVVGVAVVSLGVEEGGVDEAFGDSLLSNDVLLPLEAS
jgi:hypothetical protein